MKYRFEFTRMELQKNELGKNDLLIKQVKLMDENGKYIKFTKINEEFIQALKENGIVEIKK